MNITDLDIEASLMNRQITLEAWHHGRISDLAFFAAWDRQEIPDTKQLQQLEQSSPLACPKFRQSIRPSWRVSAF